MKQEKNLKKVKVVKHWENGSKHYEDCPTVNIDFYAQFEGKCNCYDRSTKFNGWKISDLDICSMEARAEIFDKRLMYKTRTQGYVQNHCSQGCAETWKKDYC